MARGWVLVDFDAVPRRGRPCAHARLVRNHHLLNNRCFVLDTSSLPLWRPKRPRNLPPLLQRRHLRHGPRFRRYPRHRRLPSASPTSRPLLLY